MFVSLVVVVNKSCALFYTDIPAPVELTDIPSFVNSSEIMLRWRKPSDNGANITRYTVYQRIVSEDTWQFIDDLDPPTCEYVIPVERGKKYEFIVTATNRCGEGEKNEDNAKRVDVSGRFSLYVICSYFVRNFVSMSSLEHKVPFCRCSSTEDNFIKSQTFRHQSIADARIY